jgi:hypothetical protein
LPDPATLTPKTLHQARISNWQDLFYGLKKLFLSQEVPTTYARFYGLAKLFVGSVFPARNDREKIISWPRTGFYCPVSRLRVLTVKKSSAACNQGFCRVAHAYAYDRGKIISSLQTGFLSIDSRLHVLTVK